MASPEKALRNLGINQSRLLKYPEDIGSEKDGLQHFMLITEYQFKNNTRRNKDPLTDFSDMTETERFYESRNAFALYLPKGSLKTQYSASHGPVEFGFFGALLNAESSDILDRLQSQLPGIVGGLVAWICLAPSCPDEGTGLAISSLGSSGVSLAPPQASTKINMSVKKVSNFMRQYYLLGQAPAERRQLSLHD